MASLINNATTHLSNKQNFLKTPKKHNVKVKRRIECRVCGDDATGYNFGAIVCESCKSFYRRHAHRRPKFRCFTSGKCNITRKSRRHCAACRLRKCFAVGMIRPDVDESDLFGECEISSERRSQRNLLVSRLTKRIECRDTAESKSETVKESKSLPTSTSATFRDESNIALVLAKTPYEDLERRVNAATCSMRLFATSASSSLNGVVHRTSSSDAVSIQLALNNYVHAMKHFPEVLSLGDHALRCVLSDRILAQLNLYSLFAVNCDVSGWSAVDANGLSQEQRFEDFLECLGRDGVDASGYVESFRNLAKSLRSRFEADWATVLVIVSVIDLCLPSQCVSTKNVGLEVYETVQIEQVRLQFESFLRLYLHIHYGTKGEFLFQFCKSDFRQLLDRVVETQRTMLFSVKNEKRSDAECVAAGIDLTNTKNSLLSQDVELFRPIVSFLSSYLTS